jgi:2-dehydropantoate 2-reductase
MKVGIIGQGAIGSLFAYYYRHESPTLLVKGLSKAPKKLLTLEGIQVDLDFQTMKVTQANNSDDSTEHFDAIIIAVKGYQMETLITQLIPWVPVNTRLVLIQNGMGGAQLLAKAFPRNRIYTGTTTDAVYGIDEFTYKITSMGKLDIGPLWLMSSCEWYTPKIIDAIKEKMWAEAFFSCHPNYEYHEDIAPALFTKLGINAVINPLTATLQIRNGQLCEHPDQVKTLKIEIFKVYSAINVSYSKKALSKAIDDVIAATSNNWSSMQQDVEHHRPTENETVLGYLLSLAKQYELKTPLMKKLYMQLKELDQ